MGIEVRRFTWDYLDSNMYIVSVGDQVLVIDPIDSDEAFEYVRLFPEITVLLTHEHFDHVCGLNRLRAEHKCTVIAQEKCSERIQSSKTNFSAMAETLLRLSGKEQNKRVDSFTCEEADLTFEDRLVYNWEGKDIEFVSTPGHSPGSTCITISKYLFTGDTLLKRGPMNRFPGGSERDYQEITVPIIKEKLKTVEIVYPGHGDSFSSNIDFTHL